MMSIEERRECGRRTRDNSFGRALDAVEFVQSRTTPMSKFDLADGIGCHHRTALRLLHALEARGYVRVYGRVNGTELRRWVRTERAR